MAGRICASPGPAASTHVRSTVGIHRYAGGLARSRAPHTLDAIEASTLPMAALTAWMALVELGQHTRWSDGRCARHRWRLPLRGSVRRRAMFAEMIHEPVVWEARAIVY